MDILTSRLFNQHLLGEKNNTPVDVVGYLGAVQAQDFSAAKWSIALRMKKGTTDSDIETAFNEGKILRTHVLRPTWHFVLPVDIDWMLTLTAPRIITILNHYDSKLELSEAVLSSSYDIIIAALSKTKFLTRTALANQLKTKGIVADGQRLGHIVMHAELKGLICSGPRVGKQFTYALFEERVPKTKKLDHDASLAELTIRYFNSHGPAQLKDFVWWSGLGTNDAKKGIDMVQKTLIKETVNNKTYWFKDLKTISPDIKNEKNVAFLLSIFDEYLISYTDRSDISSERYIEKFLSMGNALLSVVVLNRQIVGTWKRVIKKNVIEIDIRLFKEINPVGLHAIERASQRYGECMKMSITQTNCFEPL